MRKIKAIFIVTFLVLIGFYIIPEIKVEENKEEAVKYIASEMDYPEGICNFMINTKVGRKISYIFLKKEVKKEIRSAKRQLKKSLK